MERKSFPSEMQERFIVRLPDGMRDRIAEAARQAGRSMNAEIVTRLLDSFSADQESVSLTLDPQVRELIEASAREKGVGAGDEIRRLLAAPVSLTEINHVLLKQISRDQREILATLSASKKTVKRGV